jgi:hypothetical protein
MGLHAVTVFLSAFLLFQIQPIIAKAILPWFGGSAAVWTTCMLFFQTGLLAGYCYSHYIVERLAPKTQAIAHTALLAASLLSLPVLPGANWKPASGDNPTGSILLLLTACVGLPYVLLSTTSPLVQVWYARENPGVTPYRLFALSNLGSMLALLSYPVGVEPYLRTTLQGRIWSASYVAFGVLCAFLAWRGVRFAPQPGESEPPGAEDAELSWWKRVLWLSLAACPSALMLAVTNHLTQDVASMPFLWIVPLALYLLSFILTFDTRGWYHRNAFLLLLAPALGGMAYMQWSESSDPGMKWTITLFAASLFVACMFCHGELAARKPDPRRLTSFYLMLSTGGAMGGLFVGVVAPYTFRHYFELPVAIGVCSLLAVIVALEEPDTPWKRVIVSIPAVSLMAGTAAMWAFLGRSAADSVSGYRVAERNFYGTLRVRQNGHEDDWDSYRTLLHGAIDHGEQWTHPARRREHLTYYCANSGIGRAIRINRAGRSQKIGVVGLGAGSMAAFGRPGDEYRFYEINAEVPKLAASEFSYLADCPAPKEIVMGDGRLSLEREPNQNFDLLMMDAFSGDSIPVHLVTREAFLIYLRHIRDDGVIVIHISNKYLNLEPVLARLSEELRVPAYLVDSDEDGEGNCFGTTYVIFAKRLEILNNPLLANIGRFPLVDAKVQVWTDDYSNIFNILK